MRTSQQLTLPSRSSFLPLVFPPFFSPFSSCPFIFSLFSSYLFLPFRSHSSTWTLLHSPILLFFFHVHFTLFLNTSPYIIQSTSRGPRRHRCWFWVTPGDAMMVMGVFRDKQGQKGHIGAATRFRPAGVVLTKWNKTN